jgi:hypothetical protein
MDVPEDLATRIAEWERLSRWERSELGRALRRVGMSYGEIMDYLEVKKSTLATWCRDIELTAEQKRAIELRTGSRAGIPVDTQWRRRLEIEDIRARARREASILIHDPFWIAGVVLYWGEGAKTCRRLQLAHSEAEALRMFASWTRRFHDPDAAFRGALNLHANNDEPAAREYWANELGLDPMTGFTKTFIKPDGTGHRKNHLRFGVCSLRMARGTDALIRTLEWVAVVRTGLGS